MAHPAARTPTLLALLLTLVACGGGEEEAAPHRDHVRDPGGHRRDDPPTTTISTMAEATNTASTGAREVPLAVGEVPQVGDWRIRVAGVTPDATDQVLEENQFNEPPAEGRQSFMVHLGGTYVGPSPPASG